MARNSKPRLVAEANFIQDGSQANRAQNVPLPPVLKFLKTRKEQTDGASLCKRGSGRLGTASQRIRNNGLGFFLDLS